MRDRFFRGDISKYDHIASGDIPHADVVIRDRA